MATIEILKWKENFTGFTGWDAHARTELKKRLRRGIKASPEKIKRLARQVHDRQLVCLHDIYEEGVDGLVQILQTTGAEVRVTLDHGNSGRLFRYIPRR